MIDLSQARVEPNIGFSDDALDALAELPAEEKEVVDLRFLRGMKIEAIAKRLGISAWMVRRRLQVAVARLRLDSLDR